MRVKSVVFFKSVKSILSDIRSCFTLCLKASPLYTLLRVAGKLFVTVQSIVSAYLMKHLIDLLSVPSALPQRMQELYLSLLFLALLIVLSALMSKFCGYASTMQNDILQKYIAMRMMNQALSADLSFFDDSKYYDRFEKVQADSHALTYITWSAIDCISAAVSFLSSFVIIGRLNIWYALAIAVLSVPAAFAGKQYTKALYSLETEQMNDLRKRGYLNLLATNKRFAQSVRLYDLGDYLKTRYDSLWLAAYLKKKKLIRSRTVISAFLEMLPEVAMVVVSAFVVFRVIEGKATVGDFTLHYSLLSQLSASILILINSGVQVYDNRIKVQNVMGFEEIPHQITDSGTRTLEGIHRLELRNVSFCYPDCERKVLDRVSFAIEENQKIALIGINGSGKSTLIKLLLRFYDPTEGSILINGINIREYTLSSLRGAFACYFQNELNFGFSLKENITISDWKHTAEDDAVKKALRFSTADSVLTQAEQGWDTPLSRQFEDHGMELSGGQTQKVAIARAFYRADHAEFLIFDEPSSALDPQAEKQVLDGMKEVGKGKMMLFTSHQLRNVSIADRVVVLENGKVLESGTKEELLQLNGRFAELYRYQAEHYQTVSRV